LRASATNVALKVTWQETAEQKQVQDKANTKVVATTTTMTKEDFKASVTFVTGRDT